MSVALVVHYCGNAKCLTLLGGGLRFCDQCAHPVHDRRAPPVAVQYGPVVAQSHAVPDRIAGVLGPYVLLRLLGQGGMGTVFHTIRAFSGQQFAIKRINAELQLDRRAMERFAAEARTQSQLVHPNVVRVFSFEQIQGSSALVMEFVDGATMEQVIARHPSGAQPSYAAWLLWHMAAGLATVHEQGWVHADIKPSNYFCGSPGTPQATVKIGDFGIARSLDRELRGGRRRRSGTPGYMSPEQIEAYPLTPQSDLYSLGLVAYELLVGKPPFPLHDPRIDELHRSGSPPPIASARPDVPRSLRDLVMAMLDKSPRGRPQSAQQVMQAAYAHATGNRS